MSIQRTRNAAAPSLQSPCVRNCCLDEHNICLGCGRSLDEILQWHRASTEERSLILERAADRRRRS